MRPHDRTHGARPLSRLMSALLIAVLLVAAAAALWLVVSFPLWWADAPRIGLPVALKTDAPASPVELDPGFGHVDTESWRGELEIELTNAWAQWAYTAVLLAQIVLAALILDRLRRVVVAFVRGEGLSRGAARHLRWAGGLMVLESIVTPAVSTIVSWLVLGHTVAGPASLAVDWSSGFSQHGFLGGWVLVILSAAIEHGAELRDDQSLTV